MFINSHCIRLMCIVKCACQLYSPWVLCLLWLIDQYYIIQASFFRYRQWQLWTSIRPLKLSDVEWQQWRPKFVICLCQISAGSLWKWATAPTHRSHAAQFRRQQIIFENIPITPLFISKDKPWLDFGGFGPGPRGFSCKILAVMGELYLLATNLIRTRLTHTHKHTNLTRIS